MQKEYLNNKRPFVQITRKLRKFTGVAMISLIIAPKGVEAVANDAGSV